MITENKTMQATEPAIAVEPVLAAETSCVNCYWENTCGYSGKAYSGERNKLSYNPCKIGSGFQKAVNGIRFCR